MPVVSSPDKPNKAYYNASYEQGGKQDNYVLKKIVSFRPEQGEKQNEYEPNKNPDDGDSNRNQK